MANKVEIIVVAKDNTGPVFDAIEAKAKASGEKAGKAAGDGVNKGIQDSVKDTNGIGDKLSAEFEKAGKDAGDKFTASLGDSLVGKEFAVDFTGVGVEIGTQIGDGIDQGLSSGGSEGGKTISSRLREGIADVGAVGVEMGTALVSGISSAFSQGSGPIVTGLIAGLIAGIVVASPLLAAALAGAIAGAGVLTTVIGGAVAAAVTSPEVQAAGTQLGETLFAGLKDVSAPFVAPLLEAIDSVILKFGEIRPVLDNLFANSADLFQPLVDSLLDFTESIATGLDSLVENAGPEIMSEIAAGIRYVGEALQYMLEKFGETEGVAEGVSLIFTVLGESIVVLTDLIAALAERFAYVGEKIQEFRDLLNGGEGVEGEWIENINGASAALGGLAGEAERTVDALKSVAEEQLAQIDPLYAFAKAQEEVAKKAELYNQAVEKHGPASDQARNAALALNKAILEQQAAAEKTSDAFKGWTPEMEAAARAAGVSQGAIDGLRGSVEATQAELEKYAAEYIAKIVLQGDADAKSRIGGVASAIAGLPDMKIVTISVGVQGAGLAYLATGGSVGMQGVATAATGGIRGNMVMVGEQGPEIVRLPYGSTVIPHGQTQQVMDEQQAVEARRGVPITQSRDSDGLVNEIRKLGDRMERMQLVIDGRVLGAIQGRDSDLLYRTA